MKSRRKGNLFVVSAPSGAGKTTLCHLLTSTMKGIRFSISFTTRRQRQGEVNDRDYTFIREEGFKKMAETGEFAEWARVYGNLYGTSRKRLEDLLESGVDVILDIDVQGAAKLRKVYPDATYIFILPPSMDALKERLQMRMSDSEEDIRLRMAQAVNEIMEYKNYDYVIVNNIFDEALRQLQAIVTAVRMRRENIEPSWLEENFLKGVK